MIKLIIFDLDGTLLNTIDDIAISLNKALTVYSLNTHSVDVVKQMVGNGVDKLISRAIGEEECLFDEVKKYYLEDYNKNCSNNTKPYDGILKVLNEFKLQGIKLAVLSNKPHVDTIKVIKNYFGNNIFDVVLGKTDYNRIKPYPDGVNEIKNKLNINDNIVFVGDSDVDIMTAKNSNVKSIAVLWGFRTIQQLPNADYYASSCEDLLNIIKEI